MPTTTISVENMPPPIIHPTAINQAPLKDSPVSFFVIEFLQDDRLTVIIISQKTVTSLPASI
jgi:hypothetical protein